MSDHDRRRHSAFVGPRPSDRGGVGLRDGAAAADAGVEEIVFVIPGRREASNPESRDSPMRNCTSEAQPCGCPGMTDYVNTPTIAPIRQVVSVPDTIDFNPSALISSRRSGAIVPSPPIMMPRLPKLAKPHIA